jgi:hypothetical protein
VSYLPAVRTLKLTKRVLIGLCSPLIVAVIAGATYQWAATRRDLAATPPPGRLVDVGGHRLHIWCTGSGTPSVILETGLGGSSADWGFVQPEVAGFTRVCSYDRAGMGYSDPGPSPPYDAPHRARARPAARPRRLWRTRDSCWGVYWWLDRARLRV